MTTGLDTTSFCSLDKVILYGSKDAHDHSFSQQVSPLGDVV